MEEERNVRGRGEIEAGGAKKLLGGQEISEVNAR